MLVVQLAPFGGPSGMSDMKKVMMNDHVEDKKPVWGALLGSSAPSSPLSPSSSSEPSSNTPSYTGEVKLQESSEIISPWRSVHKIRQEYMSHIWLWNEISTKLASGITPHTLSTYLKNISSFPYEVKMSF